MGRAKATTFTGFCTHHDKIVFQPIEDVDYIPDNQQQSALFAFRAMAKERHAKLRAYNASTTLEQQFGSTRLMHAALRGQSQALQDIEAYIDIFRNSDQQTL
jgi:hypothetical protein